MLATLDHRLCLKLYLNAIKLILFYNGCVKAFVHFSLMFDLTDVDGIDQNVVYAPTAPVSLWPESIYGTLYFAQTPKLFIEIIDMPDIRGSLFTYLERLYLRIRVDLIAPGDHTPHPHAFLLGGRDLITNTLCGNFALKLGKG